MTAEQLQADVDRLLDECERQGHPRYLDDARALSGIAVLLVEHKKNATARTSVALKGGSRVSDSQPPAA